MKLSKSDALLVHSLLFHGSTLNLSHDILDRVADLLSSLENFLLSSSEDDSSEEDTDAEEDEDEDEEDSESEEEDEDIEHDAVLASDELQGLPVANVTSPAGDKVTLQFEDVDSNGAVDALLDDGSVIISDVSSIVVKQKTIELHDGEEWHVFTFRKLPRAWLKTFELDTVYGVN